MKILITNDDGIDSPVLPLLAKWASKLGEVTVKIVGSAGADGRFYGSVTTKDISEALKSQFAIEIDKRKLELDCQIKAFGTYKVEAKLYSGISGKFNVQVVEK